MDTAEQFASDFLRMHGLRPERFRKEEMGLSKTPDFRVLREMELVAYAETKHIQHDDWLDKQIKDAEPLEIVGGPRPDPIFNRLTTHIHNASQQFASLNPKHAYPNLLFLVNSDEHCSFHGDLVGMLTGNFYAEGGLVEPIYEQFSNGRIREEKLTIDLFVWWDEWKVPKDRPRMWFWRDSKYYAAVCTLVGSSPAAHRKVS